MNVQSTANPPTAGRPAPERGGRRTPSRTLLALTDKLTDRDLDLLDYLADHRVLTTPQIHDVLYPTARSALKRLYLLYERRVVGRFRPVSTTGSAPYHWVLDQVGADIVAARRGMTRTQLGWTPNTPIDLAYSRQLDHLTGTNGFFTTLTAHARRVPGCQLSRWWSARRCAHRWGHLVRPDGAGVWTEPAHTVGGSPRTVRFVLEYDTGSMPLRKVVAKLDRYAALYEAEHPGVLLFRFATPGREANARRAFAEAHLPIATAVLPSRTSPAGRIWLPASPSAAAISAGTRHRLVDLAGSHHPGILGVPVDGGDPPPRGEEPPAGTEADTMR